MEPNDILRCLVALLTIISIGVIVMVMVALIKSTRRRVSPPPAAPQPPTSAAPRPARLQPLPLPELVAEAAETPPDERLINAAASTLKTLPAEMQTAVWVAVTPRVFNADLIAALRPEWAKRSVDVTDRLQRLWFVNALPNEGSCVQAVVRRAMLRHLFRKEAQREDYLRHSLRAAKYFHTRMMVHSVAYSQRNARFVSDTFFRFLPPNCPASADTIEWLYHLAVGDPLNAQHALDQLGMDWLASNQLAPLQSLIEALREHADEGRLTDTLNSLVHYYVGALAWRANRVRETLSALEYARRLAHDDPTITPRILHAISAALDVINPTDRSTAPDSAVWSSLARPVVNRLHWSLWGDLQLPQPSADRLRRSYETLNVYRAAGNRSGAGTMMRLIGDEHLARGDYRQAREWYQNSLDMLKHAIRREGTRGSLQLDEALTLKALGDAQYLMGRSDEALQSYEAALQVHASLPDDLSKADTHKAKGDVLHFLRRYAEALPEYEVALAAYRRGGAVISEGETLLAQGRLLEALNHQEEAWRSYEEALEIYRRCGSNIGLANALLVIGSSLQLRGKSSAAAQRFEEALKIYRAEKNEVGEAAALKALGDALVKLKQLERAGECYAEALTQFKTTGLRRNEAETKLSIGRLCLQRRDYEGAAEQLQLALIQFHDIEDRRGEADAQLALGEARHMQRNSAEAMMVLHTALAMYRQTRDRFGEAQAVSVQGEEFLLSQNYAQAATHFEAALNLWKEIGDPIGAVELLYGRLGHTLALLDRRDEAVRAFDLAADDRSPSQFGWLGWRAITAGQFDDALVHFTAMSNRDQTVSWQIGLALASLARGKASEASTIMSVALDRANTEELGDACRWCEYVARLAPDLNLKPDEQFGLRC